jgi:hypothetical protein
MRVGSPYATRVSRLDQGGDGLEREFGGCVPRRHRQGGTEGQTHLDGILQEYQERGALGVGTGGAGGHAKPLPIEGMGRVLNGDFLYGIIE